MEKNCVGQSCGLAIGTLPRCTQTLCRTSPNLRCHATYVWSIFVLPTPPDGNCSFYSLMASRRLATWTFQRSHLGFLNDRKRERAEEVEARDLRLQLIAEPSHLSLPFRVAHRITFIDNRRYSEVYRDGSPGENWAYVVTRQYVFLNITYVSVQSSPSPPMVLMTRSAIPFRMPTRTTLMRILVKTRAPTTTFTPKNGLLFARISTASDNTSAQTASAQEHADAIQREKRTADFGMRGTCPGVQGEPSL